MPPILVDPKIWQNLPYETKTILVWQNCCPSWDGVRFSRSKSIKFAKSSINDGALAAMTTMCGAVAAKTKGSVIGLIGVATCVGFVITRMGHVRDAARIIKKDPEKCLQVQFYDQSYLNLWKPIVVARKCVRR